jgi:hypothetical protein
VPHAWPDLGLLVRHDRGDNEGWQLSVVEADCELRAVTKDLKAVHQNATVHSYRDEGHGVVKLGNQVTATSRILALLPERLIGQAAG